MNRKKATTALIVFGLAAIASIALAEWEKDTPYPSYEDANVVLVQPGTYPDHGEAWGHSYSAMNDAAAWCRPEYNTGGSDEGSALAETSKQRKTWVYSGEETPYTLFCFEVQVDVDWDVNGDSDTGNPFTIGTTAASAELYYKVDSEPDDSDTEPDYTNRWDGSKTEGSGLTGLGISVWGAKVSWDNTADDWGDTPDGADPVTKIWSGHVDNETDGGTYVDEVFIELSCRAEAACSGSGNSEYAHGLVDADLVKFVMGDE